MWQVRLTRVRQNCCYYMTVFLTLLVFVTKNTNILLIQAGGPGSSFSIVTGYGLDGPGIESRWGEIFCTCPDRPWGPPSTMGTGSLPGVKSGRGVTLTPHPLLVLWLRKGRAIPLLLLQAIQPVHSLSACTRMHFTLQYRLFICHLQDQRVAGYHNFLIL